MKRALRFLALGTVISGAVFIVVGAAAYASGARVNTTRSIPLGLYWTTNAPIEKGAFVIFCPPQLGVFEEAKHRGYIAAGFCPGDYGYMMKQVLAAKNDTITVTANAVLVNDVAVPHSKPLSADPGGRALPRFQAERYTLGSSELLLMSGVSDLSFDGRYFGPINRSQIKAVIRPIFTW